MKTGQSRLLVTSAVGKFSCLLSMQRAQEEWRWCGGIMNVSRNIAIGLILAWTIGLPSATTVTAVPMAGQPVELSVGQPAPDFDLMLFSGERVTLKSFRGKAVIINFWRSGWPHCQREAPVLEAAYEKYHERGLMIIGVNVSQDLEQPARDFVERYKLTFPVGHDTGDIFPLYGVKAAPTMIFIDKASNLVERHAGELTEAELTQRIEDLLK
jgi:cytochrome c biogenesis protein CcmG/thiol:disulfide interchange protein DsbE